MGFLEKKAAALEFSAKAAPPLLALAFILSYWTNVGTALILAFSAWHILLGWKDGIRPPWARIVLGFFALLAAKDFAMYLAGSAGFRSFAKSGSRVFVLLGASSFLAAYGKKRAEEIFLSALIGTAVAMAAYWAIFLAHGSFGWPPAFDETLQRNAPGQLSLWLPLGTLLNARNLGGRGARAWRLASLALGEAFMIFMASQGGWRVGPLAFPILGLIILFPENRLARRAAPILMTLSLVSLFGLMAFAQPRLNSLLFYRVDLWNGYAAKALEKPLTGWGYSEAESNKKILAADLEGTPAFKEFAQAGLGPHNTYIAMAFENGLLALAGLVALMFLRAFGIRSPPGFFDLSFMAFLFLVSLDAMNPGGLRFLGFYLSFCLLAVDETETSGGLA